MTKDGQAVASSNYNLYGASKASTDTTGNPFAYNGEARDDTGLDYLRARYYDSQGGTFLTEDSYPGEATDPLSQNRYSYVQNNSVNYTDPSGHRMIWAVDGSEPSRPRRINTRQQRFYQRSIVEQDSVGRAVSLREYTDHRIKIDRTFRAPESYYQAFGPNVATYQSSYADAQQQVERARAQAEQRRRQQIRYEYGLATGINSSPTIREGLNLDRNWNTSLQNTLKHVCNPKTTKGQDDARKKHLTASELRQLVKKANSGDVSAIAALSRSYDGKSGIGTGIRTKEEIAAGNSRVWQNTVDGFKTINNIRNKVSNAVLELLSVNDVHRVITGEDPVTGEDASRIEAASSIILDIAALKLGKIAKGLKATKEALRGLDALNDASKATISKTPEITINFTRNLKHDATEFSRQLANQQNGMNRLTVADYINNRGSYLANGRSSAGNAAQKAARNEALAKKIDELVDSGMSRSEAKSEADRWIKTQAALHDPDQIAGGFPKNVTGVGDFGINSSIGAQWKDKIATVDNVVDEIVRTTPYEDLNKIYLNVKLQY